MKKAKNISEISKENANRKFNFMKAETKNFAKTVENEHVYISLGNSKTGTLVPSVSLRPVLDCVNCKSCCKLCYDLRNDCYNTTMKTRARNAAIWEADPDRYFNEISAACKFFVSLRWHVGGDIRNNEYLLGMIRVANENKHCRFLAFTKAFDIVNGYIDAGGVIPENLQIIFSGWAGQKMNNPHNLPTSHPIFADGTTSAPENYKLCTGNCSECLLHGCNCWALKKGESVAFYAH